MYIIAQPWGGYLGFCDPCVQAWLDRANPPAEQRDTVLPATAGPPWCLHCHACGQRISRHHACPRCPCPDHLWLATSTAARFGAALGRRLEHVADLDQAWELGHELCEAGYTPDRAAALALQLEE